MKAILNKDICHGSPAAIVRRYWHAGHSGNCRHPGRGRRFLLHEIPEGEY